MDHDASWYDGSTAERAIRPIRTKSLLEQQNVPEDPPGQPGFWVGRYLDELAREIQAQRRARA